MFERQHRGKWAALFGASPCTEIFKHSVSGVCELSFLCSCDCPALVVHERKESLRFLAETYFMATTGSSLAARRDGSKLASMQIVIAIAATIRASLNV